MSHTHGWGTCQPRVAAWHTAFLFLAIFHADTRGLSAVVTSGGGVLEHYGNGVVGPGSHDSREADPIIEPSSLDLYLLPTG